MLTRSSAAKTNGNHADERMASRVIRYPRLMTVVLAHITLLHSIDSALSAPQAEEWQGLEHPAESRSGG
jgi:hypothetical protein